MAADERCNCKLEAMERNTRLSDCFVGETVTVAVPVPAPTGSNLLRGSYSGCCGPRGRAQIASSCDPLDSLFHNRISAETWPIEPLGGGMCGISQCVTSMRHSGRSVLAIPQCAVVPRPASCQRFSDNRNAFSTTRMELADMPTAASHGGT